MNIEKILKQKQGIIIDVRSKGEFMGGSVEGAINIPLSEIPKRLEEIKKFNAPLILCCASGGRSGEAYHYLSQHGITCFNGGSWLEVNYYITQLVNQ